MSNGEVFDGLEISLYDGKFQGTFDLSTDIASGISLDDEVTFIVSVRVVAANIAETRDGSIKRSNTFKIVGANAITPKKATEIMTSISQFSQPTTVEDNRPEWATAPTASLFADEPEDVYDELDDDEHDPQADADGWGGQEISNQEDFTAAKAVRSVLDDGDDEEFFGEKDDHEVFGQPKRYKDPVLQKMLNEI